LIDNKVMKTLFQYIAKQPKQTRNHWGKVFGISRSRFTEIVNDTCKSPPSMVLMLQIEKQTGGVVNLSSWSHLSVGVKA
jgi:hypothetical protein